MATDFFLGVFFGIASTQILLDEESGPLYALAVASFSGVLMSGVSFLFSRRRAIRSIPTVDVPQEQLIERHAHLPPISNEHISDVDINDINNNELYHIGFCYKRGFADLLEGRLINESPFKHSSIILVPLHVMSTLKQLRTKDRAEYLASNPQVIVLGRQSIVFRASNPLSFWQTPRQSRLRTEMDNERKYELFPGSKFESMVSGVTFSGKEIKAIISDIDTNICHGQFCSFLHSNCYSASVSILAKAIVTLKERHDHHLQLSRSTKFFDRSETHPGASENVARQLEELCNVLLTVLPHNLGQGVITNMAVMTYVNEALIIAHQFDTAQSNNMIQLMLDLSKQLVQEGKHKNMMQHQ